MTKLEALTLTPAERKAKLKEFRASAKAATDADSKSEAQEAIAVLLDATDEHDTALKAALDAKAEADAKEAADAQAIADNKTFSDNAEKEKSDKDAEEKMAEKAILDAMDEKQAKIDAALARMDAMSATMAQAQSHLDAQAVASEIASKKAVIAAFADSVKSNTVDGFDLARFTENTRAKMSASVLKSETIEDAKSVLSGKIEDADELIALVDATAIGIKAKASGEVVNDKRGEDTRVEVTLDAGDKAAAELNSRMHDAFDEQMIAEGRTPDKGLRKANQRFVNEIKSHVVAKAAKKGHDFNKAVADSATYLLADEKSRGKLDLRPARQTMADAGLISQGMVDAATSTANMLNQASVASFMLERMYWDTEAIQYCSGLSQSQMIEGAAGAVNSIGTTLRVPTKWRTPSAHDYPNTFSSLVVAENQAIPQMNINTSFADYPVFPRRLAMRLTADVIAQLGHGPLQMPVLAYAFSEFLDEFSKATDRYLYLEMDTATSEFGSYPLVAINEVPAAGNITNGNIQDGVVYGPTVVSIVQPLCNGLVSGLGRNVDNAATASTSPAFRFPIVRSRNTTVLNADGSRTITAQNPNVIQNSTAGLLVEGYMDDNGDIQSFAGTTADYAWDFSRGKCLFNAHSTVLSAAKPTLVTYSVSRNVTFLQANYGSAGNPGGVSNETWYNQIVKKTDQMEAQLAMAPNYSPADMILSTKVGSTNLRNASIFYQFLSPNGTHLTDTDITAAQYARRNSVSYFHTNAPAAFGDDTHLITKRGVTRYAVDTPLSIEGPFPSYDVTTGLQIDATNYFAREFSVIATPRAKNASGVVFNVPSKRLVIPIA